MILMTLPVLLDQLPALPGLPDQLLERVREGLPELHRTLHCFGRSNSQTTAKLMTLTMLTSGSPYRVMRQCAAQAKQNVDALTEVGFDLRRDRLQAELLRATGGALDAIEAERLEASIAASAPMIEGALKDLAGYLDAAEQVRQSNGIREGWDEGDFETAEIDHHVRTIFLHAYRDVIAGGSLGHGTLEYCEQFGLHSYAVALEVGRYLERLREDTAQGQLPGIEHLYAWLDTMTATYCEGYRTAMERMGLTELVSPWCQYTTEEGA